MTDHEAPQGFDPYAQERLDGLSSLTATYLEDEDREFLASIEGEDVETEILEYVYGRLLDLGHNPDELLTEAGVTERVEDDQV